MPKTYTIETEEGAAKYGHEIGEVVELDLEEGEATAVVCAGWILPTTKKKEN